jgi:hypothetical protein
VSVCVSKKKLPDLYLRFYLHPSKKMSSSHEGQGAEHIKPHQAQDSVQPETRPSNANDRSRSSSNEDNTSDAPQVHSSTKTSGRNPIATMLKKCFNPLSLAILALITAGIYFALQYELSVEANNLALRESCRSHPVSSHPTEDTQIPKQITRMTHTSKRWRFVKKPDSKEM